MVSVELKGKTILVTGVAGFIGANLVCRLFEDIEDVTIVGIDNMNDYYDPTLKEYRLKKIEEIAPDNKWIFIRDDISNKVLIDKIFGDYKPSVVVNLAA